MDFFVISEPTTSSSLLGHPHGNTIVTTSDGGLPSHSSLHTDVGGPDCLPAGNTVTSPLIKPQVHMPPQYHQLAASRPLSPHRGVPTSAGLYSSRPDVARVGSPLSSPHPPQGGANYELRRPPQWPPELAKQTYSPTAADIPPPGYIHPYRTLPAVGGRLSPSNNSLHRPQKHTTFNPHLQFIPYRDQSPQPQSHCDSDSSVDTVISALDRHREYGDPNGTAVYNPDIMPIRDSAV